MMDLCNEAAKLKSIGVLNLVRMLSTQTENVGHMIGFLMVSAYKICV